jgi:lysophospholipase L1-like esterase
MKLLTVGDSFTYGEELSNRNLAWPNLVADWLGYQLTNQAIVGGGNLQMVRKVVESYQDYDLVIIAWSHFARIEFADEHGIYDTWPGHRGITFVKELEFRSDLLKYIDRHYNDRYLYNQYLINIILVQNLLKQNNIKYLMLNAFGNNGEFENLADENLVSQIDLNNLIGGFGETMMEWTYGTAQGPRGHFLEAGHRIVAERINEHIRHLGWVS